MLHSRIYCFKLTFLAQVFTDHVSWRWYVFCLGSTPKGLTDSPFIGVSSSICKLNLLDDTARKCLPISVRPTGAVGFALLFFFLHLNPHQGKTFREHVQQFDFIGLFLIIGGVVLLLLGFNFGETNCKCQSIRATIRVLTVSSLGATPQCIATLAIGVCLLFVAFVYELFTKRSPVLPPRLFKVRCVHSPTQVNLDSHCRRRARQLFS